MLSTFSPNTIHPCVLKAAKGSEKGQFATSKRTRTCRIVGPAQNKSLPPKRVNYFPCWCPGLNANKMAEYNEKMVNEQSSVRAFISYFFFFCALNQERTSIAIWYRLNLWHSRHGNNNAKRSRAV